MAFGTTTTKLGSSSASSAFFSNPLNIPLFLGETSCGKALSAVDIIIVRSRIAGGDFFGASRAFKALLVVSFLFVR
jgi:hypothetical protein